MTNCVDTIQVIRGSNAIEYYLNGELHRLDGPAVERVVGEKHEWFIAGNQYFSLLEFCKVAKIVGEKRTLFLLQYSHTT